MSREPTNLFPSNRIFLNLNQDLLYHIFQYVVTIDFAGPWLLCDICLEWRNLVLNSPLLWTHVYVEDLKLDWRQHFATALMLSKQLPLHITLRLPLSDLDLVKDSRLRWETLTVLVTDHASLKASHDIIKQLLGEPLPPQLSQIQWMDEYGEAIEPPSNLIGKSNLFGKCRISPESNSRPFKRLNQFLIVDLGLWQSAESNRKMPLSEVLNGLLSLKVLRRFSFDTNLIDWDKERPDQEGSITLSVLEDLTLSNVGRFWSQDPPFQLGKLLNLMKLPKVSLLELRGVPDDIASTYTWIETAQRLNSLSISVSYTPYTTRRGKDGNVTRFKPLSSLSSLTFRLHPPPVSYRYLQSQDMNLQHFVTDIIDISSNIQYLSVAFHNSSMRPFFWAFSTYFKQLYKLTWAESPFSSGSPISNSTYLPTLTEYLPELEIMELTSCWDILDFISYQCPSLRKITYTEQGRSEAFLGKIPPIDYLQALELDHSIVDLQFPEEHPVLVNLKFLRCTPRVAEHFLFGERTPQLTRLILLRDSSVDRDMSHLVNLLVKSETIEELEFAGQFWRIGQEWASDIDAYLVQLRSMLINSLMSHIRSVGTIRTIASRTYPDWDCLLDAMSLINSIAPSSYMRSLKLPSLPNPSILELIVNHLQGSRQLLDGQTLPARWKIKIKEGTGCLFCRRSGWTCPYDEVTQCTRHLEEGFVEITQFSI